MNTRTREQSVETGWAIIEQGRNLARLHPMLDHLEPVEICERVYWMGLLTVVAVITELKDDADRLAAWGDVMERIARRGSEINSSMLEEIMKQRSQVDGATH
jgi:hypothetical protein